MPKKKAGGKKGDAHRNSKAAAARADKLIADKTFGLKNKNKSKKVQAYVKQLNQNMKHAGKSEAQLHAEAARRKAEKEAQKAAEREMFMMLGESYASKDKKAKKKASKKKKKADEAAKKIEAEQEKLDFEMPVVPLSDIFRIDSKMEVTRICAELSHKDNLTSKTRDGADCLFLKIDDGTTLNPMKLVMLQETASSCKFKVGCVLDIRGVIAIVRAGKVELEVAKGGDCKISVASERLSEWVLAAKQKAEEVRAEGGVPVEELIEQQRAELRSEDLTPVTHERFLAWKEKKRKEKEAKWEAERKAAAKKSGGKGTNVLTGRALFAYDPTLFKDDEGALQNMEYDEVLSEDVSTSAGATSSSAPKGVSCKSGTSSPDDADCTSTIIASVDGSTVELQESLYLDDGGDDDLEDLDSDDD